MATTTVTEQAQVPRGNQSASWAQPKRPWLTLYGLRVKYKQAKGVEDKKVGQSSALES